MTTTILATIGVLLAAAAALMTVFYGGSMFVDGAVTAKADTLTEAGKNVLAGYNTYELRNGSAPSDPSDLVGTGGVLTKLPDVGSVGNAEPHWVALDRGRGLERAFAVRDVADTVCSRVDRLTGGDPSVPASPDRDTGCYKADDGVPVYYVFVGAMPAGQMQAAYVAKAS